MIVPGNTHTVTRCPGIPAEVKSIQEPAGEESHNSTGLPGRSQPEKKRECPVFAGRDQSFSSSGQEMNIETCWLSPPTLVRSHGVLESPQRSTHTCRSQQERSCVIQPDLSGRKKGALRYRVWVGIPHHADTRGGSFRPRPGVTCHLQILSNWVCGTGGRPGADR
jgi:hypothetical protein